LPSCYGSMALKIVASISLIGARSHPALTVPIGVESER